jgi:hypothetical protein
MGASQVGRYRVADALPTDGAVADTAGVVAGTITGAVAGTPGMDAHPVRRYRVEDARPTDLEGEPSCSPDEARRIAANISWQRCRSGKEKGRRVGDLKVGLE